MTPVERRDADETRRGRPGEPRRKAVALGLFAIVVAAAAVRLFHGAAICRTAYPRVPITFTQSDLHANLEWAETILEGDLLGRDTYHPDFEWMDEIATRETWHRYWGGKEIFQQAPLYPYFVAGALAATGRSLEGVLLLQLAIGALGPIVAFHLAKRLFDARAGLVAAALTAVYGPLVFHEGTLLRDWLPPLLEPLALVLLLKAAESGSARHAVLAGAALGVALLAKETILLFAPAALLFLAVSRRESASGAARSAAAAAAGFLIAISPLLARNAAVGAPLFAISNRAAEGFILGNAADGEPIGLAFTPSLGPILERANGSRLEVIRATLATYDGSLARFLGTQFLKIRALIDPFEVPSNVSYAYGESLSPVLRFAPGYGLAFPLGVAGILIASKRRAGHVLVLGLYGLCALSGLLFSIVQARYRLVVVPLLAVYAAGGLVAAIDALRSSRRARAAAYGAAILVLFLVQHVAAPIRTLRDRPYVGIHVPEYTASAMVYASESRYDRALDELARLRKEIGGRPSYADEALSVDWLEADYRAAWGRDLLAAGRGDEARRLFRSAADGYERLGLAAISSGDGGQAREFFEKLLAVEPDGPRAAEARRHLGR